MIDHPVCYLDHHSAFCLFLHFVRLTLTDPLLRPTSLFGFRRFDFPVDRFSADLARRRYSSPEIDRFALWNLGLDCPGSDLGSSVPFLSPQESFLLHERGQSRLPIVFVQSFGRQFHFR